MANISYSIKNPEKSQKIVVKTASFTVKPGDSGKTFYLNSTTAITATLPKVTAGNDGTTVTFVVGALAGASDHRVTPATGDFIFHAPAGTAAATVSQSLVFANASDHVGQHVTLVASKALVGWVPVASGTAASLTKA